MSVDLSREVLAKIRSVLASHGKVKKAWIFGSRAKGTNKPGSDIDLAVEGKSLELKDILRLKTKLDDLDLAYEVDVVDISSTENKDLLDHIARVGKAIFP